MSSETKWLGITTAFGQTLIVSIHVV